MIYREGLKVDEALARFIEEQALPGTGLEAADFWKGAAGIFERFAPENRALLVKRDALQAQIDAWHEARRGQPIDADAYEAFLREIGYLVDTPEPFQISPEMVDTEVALTAGPQLVVPVLNARFLLNAANARWGSLYDALYGTDAIPGAPPVGGYDPTRGAEVIAKARAFLDYAAPLAGGSHAAVRQYRVVEGKLWPALADANVSPAIAAIRRLLRRSCCGDTACTSSWCWTGPTRSAATIRLASPTW